MIRIFFVCLIIIFTQSAFAKCLKDLYTAGISADSFGYTVADKNNNENTIGSSLGGGIKLGRIFFCPKEKLEIYSYYKLRFFNLSDAKKEAEFGELTENIFLNSFGMDTRYLYNSKQEFLLDIEARQDYAPASLDSNQQKIYDDIYTNLKILAGYRHFFKSNQSEDFTGSVKLGPLISNHQDVKMGYLSEFNFEYFRRINKKYSLRADLYYSFYEQAIGDFLIKRNELGLRYNYVFRY